MVAAVPAIIREQKPLELEDPEPVAILLDVADLGAEHEDKGVRKVRHYGVPYPPVYGNNFNYMYNYMYQYQYRNRYGYNYGYPYGLYYWMKWMNKKG